MLGRVGCSCRLYRNPPTPHLQYSLFPAPLQMLLFTHIRLAHGFSNHRKRLQAVQARLHAISILGKGASDGPGWLRPQGLEGGAWRQLCPLAAGSCAAWRCCPVALLDPRQLPLAWAPCQLRGPA